MHFWLVWSKINMFMQLLLELIKKQLKVNYFNLYFPFFPFFYDLQKKNSWIPKEEKGFMGKKEKWKI